MFTAALLLLISPVHSSSFTQLMQQTGVIEQLKQSGRSYTLFIPTNTALQSIGVTNDINRIRQVFTIADRNPVGKIRSVVVRASTCMF